MRLTQVDAFAPGAFIGNPAAVCLVQKFPPAAVMQSIAAEMNLSETAFVEQTGPEPSGSSPFKHCSVFNLRWFTLEAEVPLCGHATLAAAAVLFQGVLTYDLETILPVRQQQTWSAILQERVIDSKRYTLRP